MNKCVSLQNQCCDNAKMTHIYQKEATFVLLFSSTIILLLNANIMITPTYKYSYTSNTCKQIRTRARNIVYTAPLKYTDYIDQAKVTQCNSLTFNLSVIMMHSCPKKM